MPSSLVSVSRSAHAWAAICSDNWKNSHFRTADLLPKLSKDEYDRIFGPSTFSVDEAKAIVLETIENRAKRTQGKLSDVNLDGRILCHNFRETTYTCTPRDTTEGFFDRLDLPPWDLWISMVGDNEVLLSWVPKQLVDLVDRGVQSSAEENIFWAECEDLARLYPL